MNKYEYVAGKIEALQQETKLQANVMVKEVLRMTAVHQALRAAAVFQSLHHVGRSWLSDLSV